MVLNDAKSRYVSKSYVVNLTILASGCWCSSGVHYIEMLIPLIQKCKVEWICCRPIVAMPLLVLVTAILIMFSRKVPTRTLNLIGTALHQVWPFYCNKWFFCTEDLVCSCSWWRWWRWQAKPLPQRWRHCEGQEQLHGRLLTAAKFAWLWDSKYGELNPLLSPISSSKAHQKQRIYFFL
jgi:hypothetical protein